MLSLWILLGLIVYFFYYNLVQKRCHLPPGPTPLPIIGNILSFDRRDPRKTILQWAKEYGPVITVWIGWVPNVYVMDFQLLKKHFIRDGDNYAQRPALFEWLVGGNYGIINSSGPAWKEQRRFSLHVLRDFGVGRNLMEDKINSNCKQLVEHIEHLIGARNRSNSISLFHPIELCVGNIINALVLGYSYPVGDKRFLWLRDLVQTDFEQLAQPKTLLLMCAPWLATAPIIGHYFTKEFFTLRDSFFGWLDGEIDEHKRKLIPGSEPTDFVDAYLKEMRRRTDAGEDLSYFSEWQLKMTMFDIWVAGLETTVTTLKWAAMAMVHHPDVQKKCYGEIENLLKERDAEFIVMADRNQLPYVTATINEVQRWANIGPMNFQRLSEQDVVIGGHKIQKGTMVVPQISTILHSPEIFPNPLKFDPDRFLEDDGVTPKKVEEMIPFSIGKRACAGESLARMELFLIFSALIHNFELSGEPGKPLPSMEPKPAITLSPYPFNVLVRKRH